MGKGKTCIYSGEALEVYNKMLSGMNAYIVNRVYLNKYNRLFFVNGKGYMHILEFRVVDGSRCVSYVCSEFLLTDRGTLKGIGDSVYSIDEYNQFCSKIIKI